MSNIGWIDLTLHLTAKQSLHDETHRQACMSNQYNGEMKCVLLGEVTPAVERDGVDNSAIT